MKLTIALLLIACLQVSARGWSQDRITLKMNETEIKKVLFAIEKKTTYRFLFSEESVKGKPKVTVDVVQVSLNEVLDKILANTGVSYKILGSNLVVLKEVASPDQINAQPIRVTGKVSSSTGEALAGVSIVVKGTRTGTTTNNAGEFSIDVPDQATLIISIVGYETQEIAVGQQTSLTVTMQPAIQVQEQVVVVGYGTSRRKDLTGSVASVKGADIAKQPVQTATQAIQGKVAGVQIITSGAPNALPTVRVRGTGTMLGGAEPLYVVDGVITEDIRNINSADIVSMDILKDASATAIYGMRAANGVLLITTKKGRSGKMLINYDATVGLREPAKLVDMAGPQQYAGYLNEASVYYDTGDSLIKQAQLADGYHTDWFDVILRRAFLTNHNLSLSGGSEKVTYFFSAGYIGEQGIIEKNKFNRFTLRSNNEYRITSKLKFSQLVSYSRAELDDVDYGVLNNAYKAAPYVASKVGDLYGNTSAAGNIANPILQLDKKYNKGIGNRIQGTFALEFKPITWLTLRSSMGIDLDFYKNTQYSYQYFSNASTFLTPGGNQQQGQSVLSITDNDATKWVWDNTATIERKFGDNNLNILVGVTSEQYKFTSLVGTRRDVPANKDQWYLNAGNTNGATNNSTGDKWARNSYLARVNYGYDNRYLLTVTMRADGTSRFNEDNRWGYFPSVGAGWNIANEKFMADQEIFSALKLRGSWGRVGNDRIPTSLYYSLASINVPYYFNGTEYLGISFNNLNDKDVKWEITDEFDIGIDFTILKNRLSGELDYYNKKTKDALIFVNIPAILGDQDNRYITNAAAFENNGVELSLNWTDKVGKDWTYSVGGNVAYNKNRIVGLNGGQALFDGGVAGQG
ncbi:MAG TPA: SusC/RagA family TonB-linked outer membrane protein, partial [Chitinophagaceae bacterium]|nr:SusC/RagA family TonB-linked outer membrane protein [Chitinophagaceae bacterium]